MADSRRPASLKWVTLATGVATFACLLVSLWPFLSGFWVESDDGGLEAFSPSPVPWLLAFAVGALALQFVRTRSKRAPAWLLLFWTFALGLLPSLQRPPDLFEWFLSLESPDTPMELMLTAAAGPATRALLFVALLVPWLFAAKVALDSRVRAWFGCEPEAVSGSLPRAHALTDRGGRSRPLLLALVLFSLWGFLGLFAVPFSLEDSSLLAICLYSIEGTVFDVLSMYPFVICAGLILWLRHERLTIDRGGVRLFAFRPRYSLFFAPWDRVRSIDLVDHDHGARSAVIWYRSRLFVPFSLGVHARRFLDGERAIDELTAMAEARGVTVRRWFSSSRTVKLAWSMIALGPLLLVAQNLVSYGLMRQFDAPKFPANMVRLAGLFPLTTLHVAAILFVGLGFGLLSAHHRGGSRPVLLTLLMIATASFPDPLIHWLVWIASYSILTARFGTPVPVPGVPAPEPWQWDLALNILRYSPAFAAFGYYAGVAVGRRPMPITLQGSDGVREPCPASPDPLAAGAARRLEDEE